MTSISAYSSAGHWLFVGRRWLDLRDPFDRSLLEANMERAKAEFPYICACDTVRSRLLSALECTVASWTVKLAESGIFMPIVKQSYVSTGPGELQMNSMEIMLNLPTVKKSQSILAFTSPDQKRKKRTNPQETKKQKPQRP